MTVADRVQSSAPYPCPPDGGPARVAFVGQRTYFEACAPAAPSARLVPRFLDFRGGANVGELMAGLAAFVPHAVVVFRPEILPAGLFADLQVPVVGFTTEPLPRPGAWMHPLLASNLRELQQADRHNVDRVICFDPNGFAAAAEIMPAWRSMPLPVDDRLYRPVMPSGRPPRVIFLGYSTFHRETMILSSKHEFDIGHYAHGLFGEQLREAMAAADVGINLHGEPEPPSFENRVLLHLASGHLVLSEPLSPTFGLEPEIDYLEIHSPEDLSLRMHQIHQRPDSYERVRIRGRNKAEQFRASRVWPVVIDDLFADLAAFGTDRHVGAGSG